MAEFVEVMKHRKRMCDVFHCGDCKINQCENAENKKGCDKFIEDYPQEAEEIIMKWAKEHPVKTNTDKFKEVFGSDIKLTTRDGRHCGGIVCPAICCSDCEYKDFWNKEYKEPMR